MRVLHGNINFEKDSSNTFFKVTIEIEAEKEFIEE
jgi:hypothetical protein